MFKPIYYKCFIYFWFMCILALLIVDLTFNYEDNWTKLLWPQWGTAGYSGGRVYGHGIRDFARMLACIFCLLCHLYTKYGSWIRIRKGLSGNFLLW